MRPTGTSGLFLTLAAAVSVLADQNISRPALDVPHCPRTGEVTYNKSVPDMDPFPETKVSLCYGNSFIHINFTALDEEYFYCVSTSPEQEVIR